MPTAPSVPELATPPDILDRPPSRLRSRPLCSFSLVLSFRRSFSFPSLVNCLLPAVVVVIFSCGTAIRPVVVFAFVVFESGGDRKVVGVRVGKRRLVTCIGVVTGPPVRKI